MAHTATANVIYITNKADWDSRLATAKVENRVVSPGVGVRSDAKSLDSALIYAPFMLAPLTRARRSLWTSLLR